MPLTVTRRFWRAYLDGCDSIMIRNEKNWLWVTWEVQRRNRSLSSELGAKLVEIDVRHGRTLRYPISLYRTLMAILKNKPAILFVQNPSLLLAMTGIIYNKLSKRPLIIDSHNAGITPSSRILSSVLDKLARYIIRNTPMTVVTNDALADYVKSVGGHPIVLPDPLPRLQRPDIGYPLRGKFNVVFICTWALDEPYEEVIQASEFLDNDIYIYITGNGGNKPNRFKPLPENIVLTGFLNEDDFSSLLFNADAIMDLTTRENCLVCGAYEAISTGKPLLLSDTRALRNYFDCGAIFTKNNARDIASSILYMTRNIGQLTRDAVICKRKLSERWRSLFNNFLSQIESTDRPHS